MRRRSGWESITEFSTFRASLADAVGVHSPTPPAITGNAFRVTPKPIGQADDTAELTTIEGPHPASRLVA